MKNSLDSLRCNALTGGNNRETLNLCICFGNLSKCFYSNNSGAATATATETSKVHRFNKWGWRMVKSETRRDAEILVRNPSPRLFGKKFRHSKKVKTNHAKTRLRDLSKTLPRFRDPAKIFRDPRFSWYHSPPL